MGLMTELFVADEPDAKNYDPQSAEGLERVQLGGLTNLEFETLWAILEGEEWDSSKHALREVVAGDDSWIHEFPPSYVERLQMLSPSEVASASDAWAKTEEIASTPGEMAPVIGHLVRLARSATEKGQRLFVWVSL